MALCDKPCCSAEARDRIRAEREAEFEAYLAERARKAAEAAEPVATANDKSWAEAVVARRTAPMFEYVGGTWPEGLPKVER